MQEKKLRNGNYKALVFPAIKGAGAKKCEKLMVLVHLNNEFFPFSAIGVSCECFEATSLPPHNVFIS